MPWPPLWPPCATRGWRKIADLSGRIEAEVEASGTTLTEIFGIGPILAARIIGTVGSVARFPTKAHYFASYTVARRRWRPQAGR
jgi:transposase